MRLLGLTGGIGMGKSAAEQILRDRGVPVADTDQIAHQLVEPGQPALAEIARVFGRQIVGADGRLQRKELARRVFGDPGLRKQLEAILHPPIRAQWQSQAAAWRTEGRKAGVVVIPLLFETNAQTEFDTTICVACTPATQCQRLLARGWSADHIAQRIRSQWSADQKMAQADYVVWNEAGLELMVAQLERILSRIAEV